jgi:crotonobetainyl-CoA:carnitine CoA-transferase CaiB-like acyl-CoA transferase
MRILAARHDSPVADRTLIEERDDTMLHRLRRAGFDLIAQGMGGITHVSGEPDGPPISVGLPICDLGTGMWAVQGIPAPLYERQRTGKGLLVECCYWRP